MIKKITALFLILIIGMSVMTVNVSAAENCIYVAPNGNDASAGTLSAPLATINAAKEKAKSLSGNVTVYFRGGYYTINDTVKFSSADKANVTYKAYNNEKVVFTSGTAYTGFSECAVNGVKAFSKNVGKDADFNVLFNEKTTLNRTRYPENGYFYVKKVSNSDIAPTSPTTGSFIAYTAMTVNKNDLFAMKNENDVMVRILHFWKDEMLTVKSYNASTGYMKFSRPVSMSVKENDRYFLENVFEALNSPGEWYLDKTEGILYYVPFEGEKADELTLWGSETETMISVDGVDGISFENIIFRGNGFNIPHNNIGRDYSSQAAYDALSCIEYNNANDFTIKNCEFRDIAACAVFFGVAVKNAVVENCIFENLGAQAVYIKGENVPVDDKNVTKNIRIYNNIINGYGRVFFNAVGVLIIHANSVDVMNNEIHDGYYTAISVGWVWGYGYSVTYNNKICNNLIYNIGQGWLSDMGGIYTLGIQPGTVLSGNVIHNVAADPGQGGYGGWGIYLDEGSSKILVEKNLVYACGNDGYHLHYGADNTVRNNIFALNGQSQIRVVTRYEDHKTADFENNILLSDKKTAAFSFIKYADSYTAKNNFLWDNSEKNNILVSSDNNYKKAWSLTTAERKGQLRGNYVIDPMFNDVENFDFTIKEDADVIKRGFETWDYSTSGTVKGSIIGNDTLGGTSAYNTNSVLQKYESAKEYLPLINSLFNRFYKIFASFLAGFNIQAPAC